jgi:hypothetical protein
VVASQSSSVPVPLGAGPAGCPQAGFSTPRCVSRGFRKNKSGPRAPRPPVPPPVLGFLVRRARRGCLAHAIRNWSLRRCRVEGFGPSAI